MKSLPALSPLIAMSARVQQLEADRRRLFTQWLAALEGSDGNVTKAAGRIKPPISRNRANKITRKFNLAEYTPRPCAQRC